MSRAPSRAKRPGSRNPAQWPGTEGTHASFVVLRIAARLYPGMVALAPARDLEPHVAPAKEQGPDCDGQHGQEGLVEPGDAALQRHLVLAGVAPLLPLRLQ